MAVLAVADKRGDEDNDEEALPGVRPLKCLWKAT